MKTFLKSHCGHADINQINTYLKIYLFPHIIKEFRQWGVTEYKAHLYLYGTYSFTLILLYFHS